jgi:hypothetical protein
MNRRIFAVIAAAVCFLLPLTAADGVMSGEKNLRTIRTQWFDIIYPPESEGAASLLAGRADGIFTEICTAYGYRPYFRMPVVITPAVEKYNAYFSFQFYSHIVMYDTSAPDSMAVFSETFLSTFRHECTHAVSFSCRNRFWRTVAAVFGDAVNPGGLFVTPGMAEGATVSYESSHGEGRLNDGYSLQMIRQAKIENCFPLWRDAQGASDIYPLSGGYYYFNGAFASWLQNTYGMEKYASFWYKCVNFQTLTEGMAFKNAYGIRIADAWELFEQSVKVPDTLKDPVSSDAFCDLFSYVRGDAAEGTYSRENSRGSRYSSLCVSDAGFAYIDVDSESIWFARRNDAHKAGKSNYEPAEKISTLSGITGIQISADGRYIAAQYYDVSGAVSRARICIVNTDSRSRYVLPETGLHDGAVLTVKGVHYIAAVGTVSQRSSLKIWKLDENNGRIRGKKPVSETAFPAGDAAYSLTDAGDGQAAYIYKHELVWSVRIYDPVSETTSVFRTPHERMTLRNLSMAANGETQKTFLFSWAVSDSMPRIGSLTVEDMTGNMHLQKTDVSGGIYYPVALKPYEGSEGNTAAYVARFYHDSKLLAVKTGKLEYEIAVIPALKINNKIRTAEQSSPLPPSESFNPLKYYARGLFLPVSTAGTYCLNGMSVEKQYAVLGAVYMSDNPWTSGILTASAGYNWLSNSYIGEMTVSGGTDTSLFKYALQGQAEADTRGFKQTYDAVSLSSSVPVFGFSRFVFGESISFFEGRQSMREDASFYSVSSYEDLKNRLTPGYLSGSDMTRYLYGCSSFSTMFTTKHRTGAGFYEYGGVSLKVSYDLAYSGISGSELSPDNVCQNISGTAEAMIPRLVPADCIPGCTYNLPSVFSLSVFPSQSYFISGSVSAVLFSAEVQHAVPFFTPVYINRITIRGSYTGRFGDGTAVSWMMLKTPCYFGELFSGDMHYYDTAEISAAASLTPNFGQAAHAQFCTEFSAGLRFYPHPETPRRFSLALGIKSVYY